MEKEESSLVYQMISYLLRYPEPHTLSILKDLKNEVKHLENQPIREKLNKFIEESFSMPFDAWVNHYIDMFDFGRLTNLYVTYLKLGEQRERGLELLKLKQYYKAAGYDLTDEELPDYLPLMLEFCASVSKETSNELLKEHAEAMGFIRDKLSENKSHYVLLFDTLFLNMKNNGFSFELESEEDVQTLDSISANLK